MQGIRRKIVYVILFEALAITSSTIGLSSFSDSSVAHASVAAVASSAIAVAWNLLFNTLFERWESRQTVRGRSLRRRAAHAIGFEAGLVITLVPLFAWWLDITLWQAFVLDLGLIVYFLVFTFVFNLGFDKVFGLPASAMGEAQQA
jgi:uncharacterized membrane protein